MLSTLSTLCTLKDIHHAQVISNTGSCCLFVLAVGEWLLILPRHASHTAGFAQPLRQIARASSSPMLPNVLTRSQLGMAEPGFEPTTLWLDIWSGFKLQFWPHKSAQLRTDPTDPLQLSVRLVGTLRLSARAHTSLNSHTHLQKLASMSTRIQPCKEGQLLC